MALVMYKNNSKVVDWLTNLFAGFASTHQYMFFLLVGSRWSIFCLFWSTMWLVKILKWKRKKWLSSTIPIYLYIPSFVLILWENLSTWNMFSSFVTCFSFFFIVFLTTTIISLPYRIYTHGIQKIFTPSHCWLVTCRVQCKCWIFI